MISDNPTQRLSHWLKKFDQALRIGDINAVVDLFDEDSYWRDLIIFTWNIKTFEGQRAIMEMLRACLVDVQPMNWTIQGEATETADRIEGWLKFDTSVARGHGYIRLKGDKCWTLLTSMMELKSFEEKRGSTREVGVQFGTVEKRQTWAECKAREESELGYSKQPYCVIIGGGQAGLALGARLKRLNVPTIILDKHERPGDAWRKRYKSLCLHDSVWYDHMPYLPFPDHWPIYSPKDKIADWLEMYAKVMELNYWHSSECKSAQWDNQKKRWAVTVDRAGEQIKLHPAQLVFATGMSGVPNMPFIPGMMDFAGVHHHSSQHPGGEAFVGKKCVVIGSNNSAHDICADLWEHGADVTMVQRSSTLVIKSDAVTTTLTGRLYSERALQEGITTEKADMLSASLPYKIMPELHRSLTQKIAAQDADFYVKLEKTGFMLDWGDDESGLSLKYLRRGSGYYIDVGASDLIIDGKIKLKSGMPVERITKNSVILSDGSELPADLIVYATGYASMNGWVEMLISKEVADKVGKCWGLGSDTTKDPGPWEGELRNMWKPTQQENLWFHGGNFHQSRHYSHYLALQLKARMEGLATPVYALEKVYHAN